jgi:hypothetical protein
MHLAQARRFFEKTDVPAMQHVETATNENFFFRHNGISRSGKGKISAIETVFPARLVS